MQTTRHAALQHASSSKEHIAYPEAIARVLSGDFHVEGRRFLRRAAS